MTKTFYLYDLENQPLKKMTNPVTTDTEHILFISDRTSTLPTSVFQLMHAKPSSFRIVRVIGQTKENMDFHIASTLGELSALNPTAKVIILSADKGYDSLIGYHKSKGFNASRIGQIQTEPLTPSPLIPKIKNPKQKSPISVKPLANSDPTKTHQTSSTQDNRPIPIDPKGRRILETARVVFPKLLKIRPDHFPTTTRGLINHMRTGKHNQTKRSHIINLIDFLNVMSILTFDGHRFVINKESPQFKPFLEYLRTGSPSAQISTYFNQQLSHIA